ncbi:MAG: 3-deoxy-D-manno-octulosonic acid transferase [Muribaculaceae bacterium]|nr:3-deoxy-D-manno-octulosonic acid transferase [Muribaculaceae bacterium]
MSVFDSIVGSLYTGGIHIYQGAMRAASLKHRKAKQMLAGRRHTLDTLRRVIGKNDRPVWVHAASLGEFEQGRPLMERLRREYPDKKIVLSFYSPSGYNVRKEWGGADAVIYLPADTPRAMNALLDAMHPEVAVFVKYEFWGNCLHELKKRGTATYLISSVFRPNQVFFKGYGSWYRGLLSCFTHIYVQDEASRKLLAGIGIDATVAGDTRFDRVTDIMRSTREIPALDRFTRGGTRLTFMAGSSWGPDEEVYFPWLKSRVGTMLTVIAPHEFDSARLERMRQALSPELKTVLLSEADQTPQLLDKADCLIIDCFGLLSSAYRYANIAYIGGGFGVGIHNINEAAVYGIPVIFGPHHDKFIEAGELIKAGGGFSITDKRAFNALMEKRLMLPDQRVKAGQAAADYIHSKLGATDIIYADLFGK